MGSPVGSAVTTAGRTALGGRRAGCEKPSVAVAIGITKDDGGCILVPLHSPPIDGAVGDPEPFTCALGFPNLRQHCSPRACLGAARVAAQPRWTCHRPAAFPRKRRRTAQHGVERERPTRRPRDCARGCAISPGASTPARLFGRCAQRRTVLAGSSRIGSVSANPADIDLHDEAIAVECAVATSCAHAATIG